jgi:hypothetical protein
VCVVDGLANAGDVGVVDAGDDDGDDGGANSVPSYEHVSHTKQMCREILSLVSSKKLTQTGSVAALKVFRKHAPEDAVGPDDDQLDIPTTYEQVMQLPVTVHTSSAKTRQNKHTHTHTPSTRTHTHPHTPSTHIHTYTLIHSTHTHIYI